MLHGTLNSHFRKLHESGVGTKVKYAEVICKDEENRLGDSGIMSARSPSALLNAVFYSNGKNFCLRGGDEHRRLKLSQLERLRDPDRYIYTENCSKNHTGTFNQLHVQSKVVPVHCTCSNAATADLRCHVHLLDTYISKLPPSVVMGQGTFYLRPLQKPKDQTSPWFSSIPVGKNTLSGMIKNMCRDAGISGKKTNHSLRATGTTEMFQAQVPEKIIQERTGHRSVAALRTYERTSYR